jgi:hypothetical protein
MWTTIKNNYKTILATVGLLLGAIVVAYSTHLFFAHDIS